MKIPPLPWRYPFQAFRPWLVQPFFWVLFFLVPLFDWFRVDMLAQKIIFLGQAYPFTFRTVMWIPLGFYGGVMLIALISLVWGRLFCGWACPHNTMTEWTRIFRALLSEKREPLPRRMRQLFQRAPALRSLLIPLSLLLAVAITFFLALCLVAFVVPPAWILGQLQSGAPHVALVGGLVLFTLIGLFLLYAGHDFCRSCCPYGMAQSVSAYHGSWRAMEVVFKGQSPEEDCKSCRACQTICPVEIDPRTPENLKVGVALGCFNCGACLDVCSYIHAPHEKPGLLAFHLPSLSARSATSVTKL